MKIFKYWARASEETENRDGQPIFVETSRGSNLSQEDALQKAREAVGRLVRFWRDEQELDRYHYGERALREEILEEVGSKGETHYSLLTRNGYGACILNTSQVMFLDLDFPYESVTSGFKRWWDRLMGRKTPSVEELLLQRVEQTIEEEGSLLVRLYRTHRGFRGIVMNRVFDPSASETRALLETFGCDPLYVRLCQSQECFRARLTPKPWRMGFEKPVIRFPWRSEQEEAQQRAWEKRYEQARLKYAVCEYVTTLGHGWADKSVQEVVDLHDQWTCETGKPLA